MCSREEENEQQWRRRQAATAATAAIEAALQHTPQNHGCDGIFTALTTANK